MIERKTGIQHWRWELPSDNLIASDRAAA
jgi:hypothetical protein